MHLTLYMLPAVIALLTKAAIYFYARYSGVDNLKTRLYLLFLFSLSIQNLSEITFFTGRAYNLPEPLGGTLYFCASVFALAFLLHLSLVMGTNLRNQANNDIPGPVVVLIYLPLFVLQVLLLSSTLVVAGFEPVTYTYTKIPGPFYFLFEAYALVYLSAAISFFVRGAVRQSTVYQRLQNKLFLFGLLPIVLLVIVILSLQRFGFVGFNTTATLPLAITFFLAVTAYATHQYRLFDIEFFLPWSKVRKRKTEFYRRIQATIAAISELRSVRDVLQLISDTLRCQVALVDGTNPPVIAHARGRNGGNDVPLVAEIPRDALQHVEQIVVAQEIADDDPQLYGMMNKHKVGAIVPFQRGGTAHWLVVGDHFSNEIYTPLDFKVVEGLFAALAERFLDDFVRVRSLLKKTQQDLRRVTSNLGMAWHNEDVAKKTLDAVRDENRTLREEIAKLQDRSAYHEKNAPSEAELRGNLTLEQYLIECEKQAVRSALKRCNGNKDQAARSLGIPARSLDYLMERHEIGSAGSNTN